MWLEVPGRRLRPVAAGATRRRKRRSGRRRPRSSCGPGSDRRSATCRGVAARSTSCPAVAIAAAASPWVQLRKAAVISTSNAAAGSTGGEVGGLLGREPDRLGRPPAPVLEHRADPGQAAAEARGQAGVARRPRDPPREPSGCRRTARWRSSRWLPRRAAGRGRARVPRGSGRPPARTPRRPGPGRAWPG